MSKITSITFLTKFDICLPKMHNGYNIFCEICKVCLTIFVMLCIISLTLRIFSQTNDLPIQTSLSFYRFYFLKKPNVTDDFINLGRLSISFI